MGITGADVVRIGGKVYTKGRALALGLINADGDILVASVDSQAMRESRRQARSAEWEERQGLAPVAPLRPANVDHDGNVIDDPAVLDAIAAKAEGGAEALTEEQLGALTESDETLEKVIADHDEFAAAEVVEPS